MLHVDSAHFMSASVAVIVARVSCRGMVQIVNLFCLEADCDVSAHEVCLVFESEKLRQISLCGFF